jgi:hypothetical protein
MNAIRRWMDVRATLISTSLCTPSWLIMVSWLAYRAVDVLEGIKRLLLFPTKMNFWWLWTNWKFDWQALLEDCQSFVLLGLNVTLPFCAVVWNVSTSASCWRRRRRSELFDWTVVRSGTQMRSKLQLHGARLDSGGQMGWVRGTLHDTVLIFREENPLSSVELWKVSLQYECVRCYQRAVQVIGGNILYCFWFCAQMQLSRGCKVFIGKTWREFVAQDSLLLGGSGCLRSHREPRAVQVTASHDTYSMYFVRRLDSMNSKCHEFKHTPYHQVGTDTLATCVIKFATPTVLAFHNSYDRDRPSTSETTESCFTLPIM